MLAAQEAYFAAPQGRFAADSTTSSLTTPSLRLPAVVEEVLEDLKEALGAGADGEGAAGRGQYDLHRLVGASAEALGHLSQESVQVHDGKG